MKFRDKFKGLSMYLDLQKSTIKGRVYFYCLNSPTLFLKIDVEPLILVNCHVFMNQINALGPNII